LAHGRRLKVDETARGGGARRGCPARRPPGASRISSGPSHRSDLERLAPRRCSCATCS